MHAAPARQGHGHILYLATCIITGKRYLGRTSRPLPQRAYSHFWHARYRRQTTEFHHDLAKHGEAGFVFEVVASFETYEELLQEERRRIVEMRPEYNAVAAGNGGRPRPDLSASLPRETWLPVPGYEGRYEVSDFGRVRGLPTTSRNRLTGGISVRRRRILKVSRRQKSGHLHLVLQVNGAKRNHTIHQLVALAFLGPCPAGKQTLHRDDDKENNTLGNLYYGTSKENGQDRVRNNRTAWGAKHHAARITEDVALKIWKLKGKAKVVDIAWQFGVTVSAVSHIHNGWSWNNLTGMPNPRT